MSWKKGRGALGPLAPLLGRWVSEAAGSDAASALGCTRAFAPFGGWIWLTADWATGKGEGYREMALFGKGPDGDLRVWSFTNDGKRSEGRLTDGSDVHPQAVAFEAQMPAGTARMIYWPTEEGDGFYFAVENKVKAGWNRFFRHRYRAAPEA